MSRPPAGRIANRYDIIEKLGQGGMGAVFRAYDRLAGQEVALKQVLLSPGQLDFASKAGTDDTDKLRLSLAREFAILAGLRHPHILSVLDYGFDAQRQPFYTMTLLENGQDFRTYAGEQPEEARYDLIAQMLQALHYLHRRGVLHRDLKPDNVFVTPDGSVKVMDFGLAKQQTGDGEADTAGTVSYMAPELFMAKPASVASDLWAVGMMAYEILLGRYPFVYDQIAALMFQIMTAELDYAPLPAPLAEWLRGLLAKDPAERPASAYDALVGLYDALAQDTPPEKQAIRESFLQASTFVGRDTEFQQLSAALDTLETENAFFLVGGESGVGKSRLLDELRIQALVKGATVLRGQAVEGGGLTFQLWRDIVRRLLLMVDVGDFQAGVLKDIVPDVSELLGRAIPPVPELTGRTYQDRLILAIVDLVRAVPQSVVLLLEDLQWAGQSMAVLEQILRVQGQFSGLMIVGNYRNDEAPQLPDTLPQMTAISLERLSDEAVQALSAAMLGAAGQNDEVTQLLQSESEGNTFFIVETVRALAEESGNLADIGKTTLPASVFTGGMQTLMRRRLSKVESRYQDVQTLAAVIGREIDPRLLIHHYDAPLVEAWIISAAEYGVLTVQDNTWRFAHDKLRETLRADLTDEARPHLYRTAAETIEAVYPDDEGYNEALFNHWQQAGDFDKEVYYLVPVVKSMQTQGKYNAIPRMVEAAVERLPADDARLIAICYELSMSHYRLGRIQEAMEYAGRALHLAEMGGDESGQAAVMNTLGNFSADQAEFDRALEYYEAALTIYRRLDDQRGIAKVLGNIGTIASDQGEYETSVAYHQQSLSIREHIGDYEGVGISFYNLGLIARLQGDYDRALESFEGYMQVSQQLGNQYNISQALNQLGIIAALQGNYEHATSLVQQSLAMNLRTGTQRLVSLDLHELGMLAIYQEDYEQARDLLEQSLAIKQQLGDQTGIAITLNGLASIAKYQGDYARATDLYQQGLQLNQQQGDQRMTALNLSGQGDVAVYQNDTARALDLYRQSLAITYKLKIEPWMLAIIIKIAMILVQQGGASRVAPWAGLASQHAATSQDARNDLQRLFRDLEAALPPDELQAALDHGATLDLETVVADLLAEFGLHGHNKEDNDKQEE